LTSAAYRLHGPQEKAPKIGHYPVPPDSTAEYIVTWSPFFDEDQRSINFWDAEQPLKNRSSK
jgi:hypothetical protein